MEICRISGDLAENISWLSLLKCTRLGMRTRKRNDSGVALKILTYLSGWTVKRRIGIKNTNLKLVFDWY
jgi:hypothetical protein